MKRYGIIGGTFNPIHLAHLYIAYEAKEKLKLDKIIFMISANPPHKLNNVIIDSKFRYAMVERAIESYEDFVISDYEIKRGGLSYTYQTLEDFKEEGVELYFISGADSLMDIEAWKRPDIVLKNCNFVAFNRGNYSKEVLEGQKKALERKYEANIILLDVINFDISASIIRKRLKEGKRVDFFLPKEVLYYIKENKLYMGE